MERGSTRGDGDSWWVKCLSTVLVSGGRAPMVASTAAAILVTTTEAEEAPPGKVVMNATSLNMTGVKKS